MKAIRLEVAEAKPTDVGKRIARIARPFLAEIGAEPGDILEIIGRRKTCAIAWFSDPSDKNLRIIRIESSVRKSAGVSLGSLVYVKKASKLPNATKVVLSISGLDIKRVGSKFIDFIKNKFKNLPVSKGEFLEVRILGTKTIELKIERIQPADIALISENTEVQILSKPKIEGYELPSITYEDIGGLHEVVQKIREIIEIPFKHPEVFQRLGITPPRGILLYGPPGCGKTLIAKALANEVGATFISINGPEIVGKYYGESEERLRMIFKEAREKAPSIIFIDEIESIAPKRSEASSEAERRIVAQLLTLLDGLKDRGDIVVIGATNMPELLDPALRRPGRLDREIEIDVPDERGRMEILQIHTRGMPLAEDVDLNQLAEITYGYTGADLAALCREAAIKALRRYLPKIESYNDILPLEVLEKMVVSMRDFMEAYREIVPTMMREVHIEVPRVHWEDIGGLDEIKAMLREIIQMVTKKSNKAKRLGIEPPSGILLYGPPGCGKTLLVKAMAAESEANFISIKGPEIYSKWVGESEKAIREIFRRARFTAPSIIFLDEVDSIAPRAELEIGESGVTRRVVSQLLVEMDGLIPLHNVIVIGATNKPEVIDPSLIRPGRFSKLIYVPPPDKKARLSILKIHTKNKPLGSDVDLETIAERTEGFSGADLKILCNEAALIAYRQEKDMIEMRDFEKALTFITPSITSEEVKKYQRWQRGIKKL